jgi:hypothetical protein
MYILLPWQAVAADGVNSVAAASGGGEEDLRTVKEELEGKSSYMRQVRDWMDLCLFSWTCVRNGLGFSVCISACGMAVPVCR